MNNSETDESVEVHLLGRSLIQTREGYPYWYTITKLAKEPGELYMRCFRKDFLDGRASRWFGQLSYVVKNVCPDPYNDCKPSNVTIEVEASGETSSLMERGLRLRLAKVSKIDLEKL